MFILALDQGTTATTAMVVSPDLQVLGKASNEIPQIYPKPGWVEHDPEAIWAATRASAGQAMASAGVPASDCTAVGITNQRETTILWDRATGHPRHNAIVWQCRRTSDLCAGLRERGLEPLFRGRTGLVLDPYFSGTKILWMLDSVPGLRADAERGTVAFGTVDTFLIWRLTGGLVHATDPSNASRTLLFDLREQRFHPDLLDALAIPAAILPEVRPSAGGFGVTKGLDFLPDGVPVAGVAGDQQAALFGQTCFEPGQSKCTYGTGAFLLVQTGDAVPASRHGLLATAAWTIGGRPSYALEGSSFIAGAAVQWLRDGCRFIGKSSEVEGLAGSVPDAGGVVFVPALAGLGAPHWDPEARGAFFGLSRSTTSAHLARAVLEGMAMQICDLVSAMEQDLGRPVAELRVDGGASANNLLMQFQADVLGLPVVRPANVDTTAMGAAMLAGIGAGAWTIRDVSRLAAVDRRFEPRIGRAEREARLGEFRDATAAVRGWKSG
jgi:glycerol kinase